MAHAGLRPRGQRRSQGASRARGPSKGASPPRVQSLARQRHDVARVLVLLPRRRPRVVDPTRARDATRVRVRRVGDGHRRLGRHELRPQGRVPLLDHDGINRRRRGSRVVRPVDADGPRRAGRLRRRRDDHASLAPGRRVRKGRQAHNLPRGVAGPFGDPRARRPLRRGDVQMGDRPGRLLARSDDGGVEDGRRGVRVQAQTRRAQHVDQTRLRRLRRPRSLQPRDHRRRGQGDAVARSRRLRRGRQGGVPSRVAQVAPG